VLREMCAACYSVRYASRRKDSESPSERTLSPFDQDRESFPERTVSPTNTLYEYALKNAL